MNIDFDFKRYVEVRKGQREQSLREGSAYAYGGDLRLRRTLLELRPVQMAVRAATRLWKTSADKEFLLSATRVSPKDHAHLGALLESCARTLHLAALPAFVSSSMTTAARVLGSDDDPCLLIGRTSIDELTEAEWTFVLGHHLGHVQNGHVLYVSALFYLQAFSPRFAKWLVLPARLALEAWLGRAHITCDRAGLICTRDLSVSETALTKIFAGDPRLPKRIAALRIFAESAYYRGLVGLEGGMSALETDRQVTQELHR